MGKVCSLTQVTWLKMRFSIFFFFWCLARWQYHEQQMRTEAGSNWKSPRWPFPQGDDGSFYWSYCSGNIGKSPVVENIFVFLPRHHQQCNASTLPNHRLGRNSFKFWTTALQRCQKSFWPAAFWCSRVTRAVESVSGRQTHHLKNTLRCSNSHKYTENPKNSLQLFSKKKD